MHRVDHPSNVPVLPTLQPTGNPGFFSNGSPRTGKPATIVEQDWLNTVQEEISNVIEGAGIALDKARLDQLFLAIQLIVDNRLPPMPFLPLLGGTMQGPIYQHLEPTQAAELTNKNYVDTRDNDVINYANSRAIQEGDRAQNQAYAWDQAIWDRVNWIDNTQGGIAFYGSNGVFTVPGAARLIEVICTGGGGGGGGNHAPGYGGGAGGAGGTGIFAFNVSPGSQFNVTVGGGGGGGAGDGSSGGSGGASQFADVIGASGGQGGAGSNVGDPYGGEGGVGYGTGLIITGGMGGDGWNRGANNTNGRGGDGGASFFGGGGRAGAPSGASGRAFGSGGGGAYSYGTAGNGGVGGSGLVLIRWNR
jgi:hypothetical protein